MNKPNNLARVIKDKVWNVRFDPDDFRVGITSRTRIMSRARIMSDDLAEDIRQEIAVELSNSFQDGIETKLYIQLKVDLNE